MASMQRKELPPIVSMRILKRNFETSFCFGLFLEAQVSFQCMYLSSARGVEVHQEEEEKKKKLVGG